MIAGRCVAAAACAALVAACTLGPRYTTPGLEMPATWKVEAPWRESTPNDTAPKGEWWLSCSDPELNRLIAKALKDSPTLELASARLA